MKGTLTHNFIFQQKNLLSHEDVRERLQLWKTKCDHKFDSGNYGPCPDLLQGILWYKAQLLEYYLSSSVIFIICGRVPGSCYKRCRVSAQKGRYCIVFIYLGTSLWWFGKQISQEDEVFNWHGLQEQLDSNMARLDLLISKCSLGQGGSRLCLVIFWILIFL